MLINTTKTRYKNFSKNQKRNYTIKNLEGNDRIVTSKKHQITMGEYL